jgi:putative two-component system response regulator
MTKSMVPDASLTRDQLKKYAEDFSRIYKSEKGKGEELQAVYQQLYKHTEDLTTNYRTLKEAHAELEEAYLDTIHRLALAAEYKDEDTGDHIMRMSRYSALLAENLGMPDKEVQNILYAAPMHDIGKIGIPDSILLKPGKLTEKEFGIMKTHCIIGANLLSYSKSEVGILAEEIAISHHEKWNGKGYPQGLAGDKIPLSGRIVALADVFDALTSKRPYKDPFPVEKAIGIIKEERGAHFDPQVVDVFLENVAEILKIKEEVNATDTKPLSDVSYVARGIAQKNNGQA